MYEYLDVNMEEVGLEEEENRIVESSIPTLQLLYRKNRITSMPSIIFMNGFLKPFYERAELFEDNKFKARAKIVDILEKVKDDFDKFSSYRNNHRFTKYLYEYFKNKKLIKIETEQGKMPRNKSIEELYIALTPLGVESLLNLEKIDFSNQLKTGFSVYKEKYINKLSFVKPENIQYIDSDSKKIKVVLEKLFEEARPDLEKKYRDVYLSYVDKAKEYIELDKEEQSKFRRINCNSELVQFLENITLYSLDEDRYNSLKDISFINNYIDAIINLRLKSDLEDFVWTTSIKVATVIKGRDYSIEASLDTTYPRCVKIELEDSSKFTLKTQIVDVVNEYGTMFFRKPSTFHDVYYSNGEKMINPSYQKLVEEL